MGASERASYFRGMGDSGLCAMVNERRQRAVYNTEIDNAQAIIDELDEEILALRKEVLELSQDGFLRGRAFRKVFDEFAKRIRPLVPPSSYVMFDKIREEAFPQDHSCTDEKAWHSCRLRKHLTHLRKLRDIDAYKRQLPTVDWNGAYQPEDLDGDIAAEEAALPEIDSLPEVAD